MSNFDMLGANAAPKLDEDSLRGDSWPAVAATLLGGVAGRFLWRKHPVLGFLNGMAVAGNVARAATKSISPRRAAENLGAHLIATAGSLSLPSHPAIGYIAGAAGANLFLRRTGDTYLERLDETVLGAAKRLVGATAGAGTNWLPAPTLYAARAGLVPIKKGQQGDSVFYVQGVVGDTAYVSMGFKADGKFGDDTESAVKKFQTAKGLPATGVVDKATIDVMDAMTGGGGASVADFTKLDVPSTTLARSTAAPAAAPFAPAPADEGAMLFGRPRWQVILAAIGIVVAGGAVYVGVRD